MPVLRVVERRVALSSEYDLSERYHIFRRFQEEYEYLVRRFGGNFGQDSLLNHMIERISKYLDGAGQGVKDPLSGDEFDYTNISSRTLRNFLTITTPLEAAISRVHLRTIQFVDLYFQCVEEKRKHLPRVPDLITNLGRSTAVQYYFEGKRPPDSWDQFSTETRIFYADVDDINIISPLKLKKLLIVFLRVPSENFMICQVHGISRKIESFLDLVEAGKTEWFQERYTGIAVQTRDGISCHLKSPTLNIPLYMLVPLEFSSDDESIEEIQCGFFDYSDEVNIFDRASANIIIEENIKNMVNEFNWMI